MNTENRDNAINSSSGTNYWLLGVGVLLLLIPLFVAAGVSDAVYLKTALTIRLFNALGAGLVAASIPGSMTFNSPSLKAGGALAVAVVVYSTNPAEYFGAAPDPQQDPHLPKQCLQIDSLDVQPTEFRSLREFTEKAVLTLHGENHCKGMSKREGYYIRFTNPSSADVTVNARMNNCADEIYEPTCWQYQYPVPMPFKVGKWQERIEPPSFSGVGAVDGNFSIGWEVRDYDRPEGEGAVLATHTLYISIAGDPPE